tara:strand:+ start:2906 stop:3529 length:624 start_codon:yes stop_codon:yes gene_type:complete
MAITNHNKQDVFTRILNRAVKEGKANQKSKESRQWLMQRAANSTRTNANNLMSKLGQDRRKTNVEIGQMYFFRYSAKHAETLPYWDAVPLIFPFADHGKHFLGYNLHYAPPKVRGLLLDKLYSIANNRNFDHTTRLNLSYQTLKAARKFRYLQPCIHMYLKPQMRSRFVQVNGNEWSMALFLPLAEWQKADAARVYSDTLKKVKGRR